MHLFMRVSELPSCGFLRDFTLITDGQGIISPFNRQEPLWHSMRLFFHDFLGQGTVFQQLPNFCLVSLPSNCSSCLVLLRYKPAAPHGMMVDMRHLSVLHYLLISFCCCVFLMRVNYYQAWFDGHELSLCFTVHSHPSCLVGACIASFRPQGTTTTIHFT